MGTTTIPNKRLKQAREQRGWSQEKVAEQLDTSFENISRWERGITIPQPHFREKLIELFGMNAGELGFIQQEESSPSPSENITPFAPSPHLPTDTPYEQRSPALVLDTGAYNGVYPQEGTLLATERGELLAVRGVPVVLIHTHQAVDLLRNASDTISEQQLGALLALEANELTAFFDEGWSVDALLEALRVVLQGVQTMSKITRRSFGRKCIELGTAAVVGSVAVPPGRYITAEDRNKLHHALGTCIAAGWKLFHTAGNAQVLAVGQAQLYLVRQNHSLLYPSVQPLFYSGVYRLIGAAQHFQGRYVEAYQAHEKAYIAALEGADTWNMAQSRSWQAYGLRERGNYLEALQMADAALRLVSQQHDTESVRLRARLLAFSAENAALLGHGGQVQARLDASKELLDLLPGYHEEFDRVSWLQQAGTCALNLKQYDLAETQLQQALDELPAQWTLRMVSTALPLARAFVRKKELHRALALTERTLPMVKASQSVVLVQEFATYLQTELLTSFPQDDRCQTVVAEAQRQLASA